MFNGAGKTLLVGARAGNVDEDEPDPGGGWDRQHQHTPNPTLLAGLKARHRTSLTFARHLAGADPRSSIAQAGAVEKCPLYWWSKGPAPF